MKKKGAYYYLVTLLILLSFSVYGQDVHFETSRPSTPVQFIGLYSSGKALLPIDSVIRLPSTAFVPHKSQGFNLKNKDRNNWIKIELSNTDTTERNITVELTNPFLHEVEVYRIDSGLVTNRFLWTATTPFSPTVRQHPNFQYNTRLKPKQSQQLYINIETGVLVSDFTLLIWDKDKRLEYQLLETKYLSYFFIINITFLLLLGIAIIQTKLRYHWYYFVYALFGFLFIYADIGLGYKNLWYNFPNFQSASTFIIASIYQIFGISFVRKYFNTKMRLPVVNQITKWLVISGIALLVITILNLIIGKQLSPAIGIINTIVYLLSGLSVFVVALKSFQIKSMRNDSIWFIIGFTPHALGIIALCLRPFGLFNNTNENWFKEIAPIYIETLHTPNFLFWSIVWEVIIVFVLIVKRLQNIYEERNNMMQQLALQRERNMNTLLTGIEKERQRIAQELHDSSGVGLSTLKMKLNVIRENEETVPDFKNRIGEVMKEVDRLYEDIRGISHNLMPKTLSKLGLLPAIAELVNQFRTAVPQIRFNYFKKIKSEHFNETAKINIYRIVQELLTNVVKHSDAHEVTLQLIQHKEELVISIEDDGVGFDIKETRNGVGLDGITSRVQLLNGTLSLDTAPQNGTFISIAIPLKKLE